MAEKKQADKTYTGLTEDERAAMKERTTELKSEARRGKRAGKTDGEAAVREAIAKLQGSDQSMAERIHEIVKANAPALTPKTWYGMPAYAKDGKVVCFFQAAAKFKSRYATFGFDTAAELDEGSMWPTAYALTELTADDEAKIAELVRKAAG
ncbi:MAG: iron chaperone [Nocardioidaceae bacterium]